jgi:hypothetical protein
MEYFEVVLTGLVKLAFITCLALVLLALTGTGEHFADIVMGGILAGVVEVLGIYVVGYTTIDELKQIKKGKNRFNYYF